MRFAPRPDLSSGKTRVAGLLAVAAFGVATSSVATDAVFATSVAQPACTTGAADRGPATPVLTKVAVAGGGLVELHGTLAKTGGMITVEGCTVEKKLPYNEYVLVKAPKSTRYMALRTTYNRLNEDGTTSLAIAALAAPATEKAFNKSVRPLHRKLVLPGLKGDVYAERGTPLELLAKKADGRKITQRGREKLAAQYLASGGFQEVPID